MEEKLAKYRADKERQRKAQNSYFSRFKRFLAGRQVRNETGQQQYVDGGNSLLNDDVRLRPTSHLSEERHRPLSEQIGTSDTRLQPNHETQHLQHDDPHWWSDRWLLVYRFLQFLLWLCLWAICKELEFGAVFFTLSLLVFIYFNTRTGPRRDNELSAYSVFNRNFENIQGTVTAEKLQNEMFRIPTN